MNSRDNKYDVFDTNFVAGFEQDIGISYVGLEKNWHDLSGACFNNPNDETDKLYLNLLRWAESKGFMVEDVYGYTTPDGKHIRGFFVERGGPTEVSFKQELDSLANANSDPLDDNDRKELEEILQDGYSLKLYDFCTQYEEILNLSRALLSADAKDFTNSLEKIKTFVEYEGNAEKLVQQSQLLKKEIIRFYDLLGKKNKNADVKKEQMHEIQAKSLALLSDFPLSASEKSNAEKNIRGLTKAVQNQPTIKAKEAIEQEIDDWFAGKEVKDYYKNISLSGLMQDLVAVCMRYSRAGQHHYHRSSLKTIDVPTKEMKPFILGLQKSLYFDDKEVGIEPKHYSKKEEELSDFIKSLTILPPRHISDKEYGDLVVKKINNFCRVLKSNLESVEEVAVNDPHLQVFLQETLNVIQQRLGAIPSQFAPIPRLTTQTNVVECVKELDALMKMQELKPKPAEEVKPKEEPAKPALSAALFVPSAGIQKEKTKPTQQPVVAPDQNKKPSVVVVDSKENLETVKERIQACDEYLKHLNKSKNTSTFIKGKQHNVKADEKIKIVTGLKAILESKKGSAAEKIIKFDDALQNKSKGFVTSLKKHRDSHLIRFLKYVGVVGAAIIGLAGLGVGAFFAGKAAKEKLFNVQGEEFVSQVTKKR